ncbi:hypothetical protein [Saccharopolyspora sp. NPDC002376]
MAVGFNPEDGSQNFRFATRATESSLGDQLILTWGGHKPRTGFFPRAESYYNVASEIERPDEDPYSPPLLPAYGGVSPHERSHGESFLDLATHSPVLLALPGATILEISETREIEQVAYDEALPVRLTRDFLAAPDKFLRHLLDE